LCSRNCPTQFELSLRLKLNGFSKAQNVFEASWHKQIQDTPAYIIPIEIFIDENKSSYFYQGKDIGPLANKRVRFRQLATAVSKQPAETDAGEGAVAAARKQVRALHEC
jgi:hypothetical protein